jgi:hypothetical protein
MADPNLIAKCKKGDKSSFVELFNQNRRIIEHVVMRMVQNKEAANIPLMVLARHPHGSIGSRLTKAYGILLKQKEPLLNHTIYSMNTPLTKQAP